MTQIYQHLHKKITEVFIGEKKKAQVVCVWQREGSRPQQQQLLQGSDANLSLMERYFPLQDLRHFDRSGSKRTEKNRWHFRLASVPTLH